MPASAAKGTGKQPAATQPALWPEVLKTNATFIRRSLLQVVRWRREARQSSAKAYRESPGPERRCPQDITSAVAQVPVVGKGHPDGAGLNEIQGVGPLDRERPPQHAVDDAQDEGQRADGQGQRRNRQGSGRAVPPHEADREANLLMVRKTDAHLLKDAGLHYKELELRDPPELSPEEAYERDRVACQAAMHWFLKRLRQE